MNREGRVVSTRPRQTGKYRCRAPKNPESDSFLAYDKWNNKRRRRPKDDVCRRCRVRSSVWLYRALGDRLRHFDFIHMSLKSDANLLHIQVREYIFSLVPSWLYVQRSTKYLPWKLPWKYFLCGNCGTLKFSCTFNFSMEVILRRERGSSRVNN